MIRFLACFLLSAFLFAACRETPETKAFPGPDEQYGTLFEAVQLGSVFPDSKTFPDCEPKRSPQEILKAYEDEKNGPGFNLKAFVKQNFTLPATPASGYKSDPSQSAEEHINALWPVLTRQADLRQADPSEQVGSRLALPKSYVVPGGRFGEVYYWDSYFTLLGLQAAGRDTAVRHMVDNFAHLLDTYGHIPNGTRSYYLSRSQPPFFALMVKLMAERDSTALTRYLPQLQREYYYWMGTNSDEQAKATNDSLARLTAYRRTVKLTGSVAPEGVTVNRYCDDRATPRPEAYKEDVAVAKRSGRPVAEVYRHLRSGAESGWDFSSRWLADGRTLETIHTTDIVPVDLNCLLYVLEKTLADAYRQTGDERWTQSFTRLAEKRRQAILTYCWNEEEGFFFDYDWKVKKQTGALTLAGVFPLYVGLATPDQAQAVAGMLKDRFLKPGGLNTTLLNTGQQWDAPNGWAPLQWVAIDGLRRYNQNELANQVKTAWVAANLRVYKATGKMVEKYNVEAQNLKAGGGEYPLQDGFGWTNGVLLKLLMEENSGRVNVP